jgi:hypothetical protein
MKVFFSFLVMFILSAGIMFFLTNKPVEKNEALVKPISTSAFSMEDAPSESLRGHIASMSGDVLWQSRVATEPAQLVAQRDIMQGENLVTKDTGTLELIYQNVADIIVDQDSEIDIVQALPASIVITQQNGNVTYKKSGSIPLAVKISGLLVSLEEGTVTITFDNANTSVNVVASNGKAKVAYTDSDNTSEVTEVETGNTFVFDTDSLTGSLSQ